MHPTFPPGLGSHFRTAKTAMLPVTGDALTCLGCGDSRLVIESQASNTIPLWMLYSRSGGDILRGAW
jgi:hypothetical protein